MEEAGCACVIRDKVCSAEMYVRHSTIGYFHPIQVYYICIIEKNVEPMEKDHYLQWIDYDTLRGKMFVEMPNWALEQIAEYM